MSSETKVAISTSSSVTVPSNCLQVTLVAAASGMISEGNFAVKPAPIGELKEGQFLVRIHYFGIDPVVRVLWMTSPYVGKPTIGYAVGDIVATTLPDKWPVGKFVTGQMPASEYAIVAEGTNDGLRLIDTTLNPSLSTHVSILGMPGCTSYFSLRDNSPFKPGATVVISGAAGTVGSVYGQLAKRRCACKLIGIAGGATKCALLRERYGFDVAIDYKNSSKSVADALREAAPTGIDHYFDCVGGSITNTVLLQMKDGGSIHNCGFISGYNGEVMPKLSDHEQKLVDSKKLTKSFIYVSTVPGWDAAVAELALAVKAGQLKYDETIIDGIANVPKAILSLFAGNHIGKVIIRFATAASPTPAN